MSAGGAARASDRQVKQRRPQPEDEGYGADAPAQVDSGQRPLPEPLPFTTHAASLHGLVAACVL